MTDTKTTTIKEQLRPEKEIQISASVAEAWKAHKDPIELANWFPLEARITPGVGGKIFLSWGPDCEGEAEIVTWEPNKKFASQETHALIEWALELRDEATVLHLIQSGVSTGADWENEWFESTDYGWEFMLPSLCWLLENHSGENRLVAWPRQQASLPRSEVFQRPLNHGTLFKQGATNFPEGAEFSVTTTLGESWSGKLEFIRKDCEFCISIRELNNALFWVTIEGASGKIEAQIWLSAFSVKKKAMEEFESIWNSPLQNILAS